MVALVELNVTEKDEKPDQEDRPEQASSGDDGSDDYGHTFPGTSAILTPTDEQEQQLNDRDNWGGKKQHSGSTMLQADAQ